MSTKTILRAVVRFLLRLAIRAIDERTSERKPDKSQP